MELVLSIAVVVLCLYGSIILAALTGGMIARITRNVYLWVPFSLVANLFVQSAYFSAFNLVSSVWSVAEEAGKGSFWSRYSAELSSEWFEIAMYGLLFGVVAWIWSLKRMEMFGKTPLMRL